MERGSEGAAVGRRVGGSATGGHSSGYCGRNNCCYCLSSGSDKGAADFVYGVTAESASRPCRVSASEALGQQLGLGISISAAV